MISHPSDVELQRLTEDESDEVTADVAAHVRLCVRCQDLITYAQRAAAALQRVVDRESAEAPNDVLQRVLGELGGGGPPRT